MLHDILGHDHLQWHAPLIRHFTKSWPWYRNGPYHRFDGITLFWEVSIGHLQWVRLANRRRLLFGKPGPVPYWTCICSNGDTIYSWTCHVYGPFEFCSIWFCIYLQFRDIFSHVNHLSVPVNIDLVNSMFWAKYFENVPNTPYLKYCIRWYFLSRFLGCKRLRVLTFRGYLLVHQVYALYPHSLIQCVQAGS